MSELRRLATELHDLKRNMLRINGGIDALSRNDVDLHHMLQGMDDMGVIEETHLKRDVWMHLLAMAAIGRVQMQYDAAIADAIDRAKPPAAEEGRAA